MGDGFFISCGSVASQVREVWTKSPQKTFFVNTERATGVPKLVRGRHIFLKVGQTAGWCPAPAGSTRGYQRWNTCSRHPSSTATRIWTSRWAPRRFGAHRLLFGHAPTNHPVASRFNHGRREALASEVAPRMARASWRRWPVSNPGIALEGIATVRASRSRRALLALRSVIRPAMAGSPRAFFHFHRFCNLHQNPANQAKP